MHSAKTPSHTYDHFVIITTNDAHLSEHHQNLYSTRKRFALDVTTVGRENI